MSVLATAERLVLNAWAKNALWLVLLWPLSLMYGVLALIHKSLYRAGFKKVYKAQVPVVVVGNISVGGSGKTPLVAALCNRLLSQGVNVGVASRGFGRSSDLALLVAHEHTAKQVGDEPLMLSRLGVPVAVASERAEAVKLLEAHGCELILCDDGLQHHALHRDLEWVLVDAQRGFGRGWLLPAGFLREPASRLSTADAVLLRGSAERLSKYKTANWFQRAEQVQFVPSYFRPLCTHVEAHEKHTLNTALKSLPKHTYTAVAGLARPERFIESLNQLGVSAAAKFYPDHHNYTLTDLKSWQQPIVTTEKDAVKIEPLLNQSGQHLSGYVLGIEAKLSDHTWQLLLNQLRALGVNT